MLRPFAYCRDYTTEVPFAASKQRHVLLFLVACARCSQVPHICLFALPCCWYSHCYCFAAAAGTVIHYCFAAAAGTVTITALQLLLVMSHYYCFAAVFLLLPCIT